MAAGHFPLMSKEERRVSVPGNYKVFLGKQKYNREYYDERGCWGEV
jgi:hypothetical protein